MAVLGQRGHPTQVYTFFFFFFFFFPPSKKQHRPNIPFGLLQGEKRTLERNNPALPQRAAKTQMPMPWSVSPQRAFHLLYSAAGVAFL